MSDVESNTKIRFHFVDSLRGIAALWVVLFHIHLGSYRSLAITYQSIPKEVIAVVFEWGYLGVPIFFVLSGFVIAHSFRKVRVNMLFFRQFTIRRLVRLSPPYYMSIILFIAWGILYVILTKKSFEFPTLAQLVTHLFYVEGIFGYKLIIDVYWTLSIELQFYVAFCLLFGLSQWLEKKYQLKNSREIVFAISGLLGLLAPLGSLSTSLGQVLFVYTWYGFLIGVFAYWAWQEGKIQQRIFYSYLALLIVFFIGTKSAFTITCILTALSLLQVGKYYKMESYLNWRLLQYLGLISYSLYLTHGIVFYPVLTFVQDIMPRSLLTDILGIIILVGVSIAFAGLFYSIVEKPSINWSRKVNLNKKSS